MEDISSFKKKINSYIKRAEEGNVCLTNFLDEAEISIVEELMKNNNYIEASSNGKIINADRVRYIFSMYPIEEDDYKIKLYQIVYNKKFYDISHRSILGSLMSLGIKRDCIGDIIVKNNKDAFFACTEEIDPFILENFHSVARAAIQLKEVDFPLESEIKYEDKTYFLSSLRLDVVVCAVYGFSRSEVLEILTNGDIYVNQVLNQNPSHILKQDDVISVRHKGKFKMNNIGGNSKSGRIITEIGKRV